jgi:hypothetical protein
MRLEPIEFGERAGIEQQLDPLARGQPSGGVLPIDSLRAARNLRTGVVLVELFDLVLERQA